MFKSAVPCPIGDYEISVDKFKLDELSGLFGDLHKLLEAMPEERRMQLVDMEADDSWRLADDGPANPFAFASPFGNVNAENIAKATAYGAEAIRELPVSTRLLRNVHYLICAGEDYDRKYRGEYRTSPVWIGLPGKGIAEAEFVPPAGEDMDAAMADLENYINYAEENPFVKAAVIHYRFEMIHPFIDGNGRTGRLLNSLFLTECGELPYPALLLSHIISRGYNDYCAEIQYVNETDDISRWIAYWLDILIESARYTLLVIDLRP